MERGGWKGRRHLLAIRPCQKDQDTDDGCLIGSAGTLPMDGLKGVRVRFGDIVTQGVSDPLFLSLGWEICCLHTSYDITSTIYSCFFGNGEVGILPVCKLCVP